MDVTFYCVVIEVCRVYVREVIMSYHVHLSEYECISYIHTLR